MNFKDKCSCLSVDWAHLSLPEDEGVKAQVGRDPLSAHQSVIADLCFSLLLGSGQLTLIIKQ